MENPRIMIVEDNTTVAKDLQGCLQELGYTVTSVQVSGEEAIEKVELEGVNLVLMDIHLRDEMNGIEAAQLINDRFEVPVVFLSAYDDRGLLEGAKRVGGFAYLIKPFSERELYASIEMVLSRAQLEKERRRMESHFLQSQKLEGLRLMAGSIAHNFNNILQGPLGYNELILDKFDFDPECRKLIQRSNNALERAVKISKLMLVYVGLGKQEVQDVVLSDEVKNFLNIFRHPTQTGVTLSVDLCNEDLSITADPSQLQELILNLFLNALEAVGDESGEVGIRTYFESFNSDQLKETYFHEDLPAGDFVVLEITDTGCGMDKETWGRIFDPFFTTKFTGRGLGLAVVSGILRGHRGAIDVDSTPGQGTNIRVLFPVSGRVETIEHEPIVTMEEKHSGGTVLLVDDDENLRLVVKQMLDHAGYDVLVAEDGQQAVEIFRENSPKIECVLLDWSMPGLSSLNVTKEIKIIQPDARIILCSGYPEEQATFDFAEGEIVGFIHKPFDSPTLTAMISLAVD